MADELYPSDFTGWSPAEDSYGGYDYNIYNIDNSPMQYMPGNNYGQATTPSGGATYSVGGSGSGTSWVSSLPQYQVSSTPTLSLGGSSGGRSGGSIGGGVSNMGSSSTSVSTTSYIGGKALPTMNVPTYNLPLYDYGRINFLAQQQAAPQYSKLRNALYTGMGKVNATDNPYMQGQARKQLLQGYGGGLSEVSAGAAKTGEQLYGQEYAGKMTEASANYQGQLTAAQAMFQAAMADWEKSFTAHTTTTTDTLPYSTSLYGGVGTGSGSGTGEQKYSTSLGTLTYSQVKNNLMNTYGMSATDADIHIQRAGKSSAQIMW